MRSKLELTFISITFFFTFLFFITIGSLFLIPTPQGFFQALFSPEMIYALKLTLVTSIISAFFVMIFAIPMAYTLSRYEFPLKTFVKSILDLPIAFPEIVIGIALLMLLGSNMLGDYFEALGISIVFTPIGVVVAQFFVALPYAVRVLYSTFSFVNPRYEFVSRSLGYSELETFGNVTLPLSKNGIFAAGIISLARCIGTFASVLFVGGGIFMKTETLSIALYLNLSTGDVDMAITAGILLVIISFIAIIVMEKYAQENQI
ncbi:ABC transporter permease [Methanobacterium alcaliphilum]|uniref:ABC transporter permease n=1 Tax=Methanobacterium alcaliphilum TaxID=392018 RepID=UPI00200A8D67|nr:ABC transporter permease [Methanobacterium alcaliphilum]MCK9151961.1 ABC transporter permease [Methanobacterium alcaliphilum]